MTYTDVFPSNNGSPEQPHFQYRDQGKLSCKIHTSQYCNIIHNHQQKSHHKYWNIFMQQILIRLCVLILDNFKAGHRSTLAFLRFCVIAATGIRKHTQVELLWITRRIRRISVFPINSERLDAIVFTSTLPATKRNSRTISTRATDVIFERKHCSRRRSHTQVDITSAHK